MGHWLKILFFALIVKPLILVVIGLHIHHRERLVSNGPAILVANHNSHLDALVLMSLFPLRQIHRLRPVAAFDYFMTNPLLAWFATRIIGIIPIERKRHQKNNVSPLSQANNALENGDIIIVFPEGTRGKPEQTQDFKTGIAHLTKANPSVPIVPIFLHGLGKALPKGEGLLVPFFCDVFIGQSLYWKGDRNNFMKRVEQQMQILASEKGCTPWD